MYPFGKLLCRFESKLRKRGKKGSRESGTQHRVSVIPACNCKLKMLSGGQLEEDPESNYLMAGEDAASRKDALRKGSDKERLYPMCFETFER